MEKPIHRFLVRLSVITCGILITGAILFGFFLKQFYITVFPILLAVIFLFTFLTFTWLVNSAEKGPGKFARVSMIVTMIRLLIFAAITLLYFIFINENAISFVTVIGLLYVIYTFFEVSELTSLLRKTENQKKQGLKGE